MRKRFRLEALIAGTILLILGAVSVIVYIAIRDASGLNTNDQKAAFSNEIIQQSNGLTLEVVNVQKLSRDYALTGNEVNLQSIWNAENAAQRKQEWLINQLGQDTDFSRMLDTLKINLRKKILYTDRLIKIKKEQGTAAVSAYIAGGQGNYYL